MATERFDIVITASGTRRVQRDIRNIGRQASATRGILAFLRSALVAVASANVLRGFLETSDALTNIQNRLRLVTNGTKQLTAVQGALFKISQRTRTSFEANAELFNRLTRSTTDLGLSFRELLGITEAINQAVAISGATTQEARNSLIQFSQGLASGTLRGDELRSVVEQFPRLASAIGKEFGVAGGALAAFAKANPGVLTTQRIITGIRKELPALAEQFEKIELTVGGAFQRFNNALSVFIGGLVKSTNLAKNLDTVLQSLANNFIQIAVAIGAIAGIAIFNFIIAQVLTFGYLQSSGRSSADIYSIICRCRYIYINKSAIFSVSCYSYS